MAWLTQLKGPGSELDGDAYIRFRLGQPRSELQSITHVDGSARIQTVDAGRNPWFHASLKRWYAHTGCPVLIKTSFNIRGEPIVRTPQDAWSCFRATAMDILVLGNQLLSKADNPSDAFDAEAYRGSIQLH